MTLSELMLRISNKFGNDIESHPVLMKINDCLFEKTKIYFNTLLFMFLFFFIGPFVVQILYNGDEYASLVVTCNKICLVVIVIFHYFEFIQVMKSDLKEYWTSTKNVLMHLYFVMYYFYYNRRMLQPEHYLLPLNHFHKDGAQDQGDL